MVKAHFGDLVEMITRWGSPKGYYKLGLLILETGARITEDVRKVIIKFTNGLKGFEVK